MSGAGAEAWRCGARELRAGHERAVKEPGFEPKVSHETEHTEAQIEKCSHTVINVVYCGHTSPYTQAVVSKVYM